MGCVTLRREHCQFSAHGDDVTGFAGDGHQGPAHRRRDLDGGLVRHHVHQGLIRFDGITDPGAPDDDLGLDGPFTQVRQLERIFGHNQASRVRCSACATRAWPGKYAHSCACG